MNKLDQKIQEINTEILALNAKKSRLLAIKFDAKGGEGSGRYPAGSSGNTDTAGNLLDRMTEDQRNERLAEIDRTFPSTNPSSGSLSSEALRERVSKLDGVSRTKMSLDKTEPAIQASLDADKVKIVADVRGQEALRSGSTISVGGGVNQVQKMIGMHPADLRDVIFADNQIPENDIIGTPQIDFKVEKFSDEGRITVGASVMTKQVEVKIKIEEDKTGYKTLKSNAYVPLADGQDHTPNNLAMMNRVSRNIVALGQAMGIAKNNIVQTKVPTKKAKF